MSTTKVEKGQKYRGTSAGSIYEMLSDPFDVQGIEFIAYSATPGSMCHTTRADEFLRANHYTLIREPKFAVGDQVLCDGYSEPYKVDGVSAKPDAVGDFSYILRNESGYHVLRDDSDILHKVTA